MKLNPDCVRDLLLEIEEVTDLNTSISFDFRSATEGRLEKYGLNELAYHLKQCELNGYLVGFRDYCGDEFEVGFLSPKGHEFLSDIRSDTVWSHTKIIAGKIGSWSLDAIAKIASSVVTELIKKQISGFFSQSNLPTS